VCVRRSFVLIELKFEVEPKDNKRTIILFGQAAPQTLAEWLGLRDLEATVSVALHNTFVFAILAKQM